MVCIDIWRKLSINCCNRIVFKPGMVLLLVVIIIFLCRTCVGLLVGIQFNLSYVGWFQIMIYYRNAFCMLLRFRFSLNTIFYWLFFHISLQYMFFTNSERMFTNNKLSSKRRVLISLSFDAYCVTFFDLWVYWAKLFVYYPLLWYDEAVPKNIGRCKLIE